MTAFTFKKEERLCSQKIIGEMFLSGSSFLCYPLKVIWKDEVLQTPYPAQVVFSVPKRLFKRAHDRNLLKRRMRESYRHQKEDLYQSLEASDRKMAIMIVYIAKEELEFAQIAAAITKIVTKFKKINEIKK